MELYEESSMEQQPQEVQMTIEELEIYRESCKEAIEASESALKLAENPDFKKLIIEDLCTEEPKRLGILMASGKLVGSAFDGAVADLKAISFLQSYLQSQVQRGQHAKESLNQAEEAYERAMEAQAEANGG